MTSALPPLGILMLDTQFERPLGDGANPKSWPFPVLVERIEKATASMIVRGDHKAFIDAFIAGGERLKQQGAIGLITSCGFLALQQKELAAKLPLPFASSSLLQAAAIEATLNHKRRLAVITYDQKALTPAHFTAVGANPHTLVAGLPQDGHFHQLIEGNAPYQHQALEAELFDTVQNLMNTYHDIGAILFECTNLPPFSAAVAKKFRCPVYDVLTMGKWFYSGLCANLPLLTTK